MTAGCRTFGYYQTFRYRHSGFRFWIHANSSQHLPFKSQLLFVASLIHLCDNQYLMRGSVTLSDRLILLWLPEHSCSAAVPSKKPNQTDVVLEMTHPPVLPPLPTFSAALGTQSLARLLETTASKMRFTTSQQCWAHTTSIRETSLSPCRGPLLAISW